ncbi:hypothetical protein CWT12_05895 [Actinomyces sp. 432]|uniref:hypothetical protein n=1 Tax=Actinomyces sp. 432 TaxID=2057798 RepID=UPI0013738A85|nr:hypothetical protein [Actinomyces sp. 432]QHO90949.1 hypothetical protein CWT12_05895 [Actinomyces sp. 432]
MKGLRVAVPRTLGVRAGAYARVLAVLLALLLTVVPGAAARADSVMGDSTMGTASTVSPSTIAVGGTLTYTLSGFPQGASVEILVDDHDSAPGGDSGVIGELTVGEDGTYAGALALPGYISKGPHWLRFRVTAGEDIPTNAVRTLDYTNKSPYFNVADVTIIGGESAAKPPAPRPAEATEPAEAAAPTDTPTSTGAAAGPAAAGGVSGNSSSGGSWAAASLPVVTTVLFALGAILLVLTVIVLIERRRLIAYERELEYAARR